MKGIQKAKIIIGVIAFAAIAPFLQYHLPSTAVVQITGTDVKRADSASGGIVDQKATKSGKGDPAHTYDVRFINSLSRDGKIMVFRNEDTGWGWPPYFKFDSADLTAEAQSFATDASKPWVLVKYYGWRIRIFSMFPNVVSLKVVDEDYTHFPLFNIVFISLLGIACIAIVYKFRGITGAQNSSKGV